MLCYLYMCLFVLQINALRMAINSLVCEGSSGSLHLRPDRISHLQEDCRDRLTRSVQNTGRSQWWVSMLVHQVLICICVVWCRLFSRMPPREAVTPVYYKKLEKWNEVHWCYFIWDCLISLARDIKILELVLQMLSALSYLLLPSHFLTTR